MNDRATTPTRVEKSAIRPVRGTDLLSLRELEVAAFGQNAYSLHVIRQYIELFSPFFFVDSKPSGIGAYCLGARIEGTQEGWLIAAATHPGLRRSGMGFALAKRVVQGMALAGIEHLRVTTSPENEASQGLLQKLGFSDPELIDDYFGPGDPRLLFRASITKLVHA